MSAIYSVVNFERPACYCSAAEQYFFSRMRNGSSKWRGIVTFVLNDGLLLNFLWRRRVTSFEALKGAIRVKMFWSDEDVTEEVAVSIKFKMVEGGDRCSSFSLAQGC
jgi:hypothetical protein